MDSSSLTFFFFTFLCSLLLFNGMGITAFEEGSERVDIEIQKVSGVDDNERMGVLERFRFLFGLGVPETGNSGHVRRGFSPAPSPMEAAPPKVAESPSPRPPFKAKRKTHHPQLSSSRIQPHSLEVPRKRKENGARIRRIVIALVVSLGSSLAIFALVILFCYRFRRGHRNPRSGRALMASSERSKNKRSSNPMNSVNKVSFDPGPELFFLDTLGSFGDRASSGFKRSPDPVNVLTHERGTQEREMHERKIHERELSSPSHEDTSSMEQPEGCKFNDNHDPLIVNEILPMESLPSDDESFHSVCESHPSDRCFPRNVEVNSAASSSFSSPRHPSSLSVTPRPSPPSSPTLSKKTQSEPFVCLPKVNPVHKFLEPNSSETCKVLDLTPANSSKKPILPDAVTTEITPPSSILIPDESLSEPLKREISSSIIIESSPSFSHSNSKETPQSPAVSSSVDLNFSSSSPLSSPSQSIEQTPTPHPLNQNSPPSHSHSKSNVPPPFTQSLSPSSMSSFSSPTKSFGQKQSTATPPKPPPPPLPPRFIPPIKKGNNPPPPCPPLQFTPLGKDGIPLPKLKPLHWDKVRAPTDRSMVWDRLKPGSFELDEEMMESLFGYNLQSAVRNEEGKNKSSSPNKHVLDPKRLQNITILSKALNASPEEACNALIQGDGLLAEHLVAMAKMAPTKEEEEKILNYKGDVSNLSVAEKFVKAIVNVPSAFARIEAMLYRETFEDEVVYLTKSFAMLEEACKELRSSHLFLKLLEAVLKTGNRMNVGTIRGGAKAFKLDALLKLADIKGTDGKTTLLHFVVLEMTKSGGLNKMTENNDLERENGCEENEDDQRSILGLDLISGLSTELCNVKKTAGIDLDALASSVSKLSEGMQKLKQLTMSMEERSSRFVESMSSFMGHAEIKIKELKECEDRVMSLVREITEYFHGDLGRDETNPLRIFVIVRDFLGTLDHVCKEVKSSKHYNQKSRYAATPFKLISKSGPVRNCKGTEV
ncbi:formin-like protein 11 [Amborella trichopoda]|nr:formin-like protein 11 [Amborella trichopoda]|eukprot:XP_006838410.2 formin-like protein 11 [Amborella trichopoda]